MLEILKVIYDTAIKNNKASVYREDYSKIDKSENAETKINIGF